MSDFEKFDKSSLDAALQQALDHNASIGGSRMVEYRGLQVLVPVRDVRDAVELLTTKNRREVRRVMASVNGSLGQHLAAVSAGTASQQTAMNFGQDIAIWFANEIVHGRASLELH